MNILDKSIERTMVVKASRERVWLALTTAQEFSSWFQCKVEGEFVPGKRLDMVAAVPGWEGVKFWFQIEEMVPPSKFSWRWLPGAVLDDQQSNTTLVTFTLEEIPGGTRVTVLETGFDGVSLARRAQAFKENTDGWRDQFANLERYLGEHA